MSIEERVTRVETVIENINSTLIRLEAGQETIKNDLKYDFRWLLTLTLSGFVGLAGLVAHALHWI